jgi:hypothetical protein
MAGVMELDGDPRRYFDRPLEPQGLQLRQRSKRIALGEQRQRWIMLGVAVPVCLPCILFLNATGVGEHDLSEILGSGRTEDAPSITLRNETRKIPNVVEMGMRQDDCV